MFIEVKVPVLAESISDATLINWHKKVGEFVHRDENLIDLETDKVMLEIPAPQDGVLSEVKKSDGSTVTSDEIIAVIDTDGKSQAKSSAEVVSISEGHSSRADKNALQHNEHPTMEKMGPAVRKLLAEHELNIEDIPYTENSGRITKEDILRYLDAKAEMQDIKLDTPDEPAVVESVEERPERRVPMTRLRTRIAERLKQAQNNAAILTSFNEVNMQPVMSLRSNYQEQFQSRHGVKLGLMSFFIKAVVDALKKFPIINAAVDNNDIIYHGFFDIGIAVSSPRGLVVPILHDADQRSFAEIEATVRDFGFKAKESKLTMDDLLGGTFTITNGGVFGSMLSTPILNPPQSAILGMHKIQERPVVVDGEIVVRPIMYIALSYDHRIIDGHEAVLFLVEIKELLEEPSRMLLQI